MLGGCSSCSILPTSSAGCATGIDHPARRHRSHAASRFRGVNLQCIRDAPFPKCVACVTKPAARLCLRLRCRHGGRDIGSAVFPETPYKFTSMPRPKYGPPPGESGFAGFDRLGDKQDSTRRTSPLTIAEDAHVIDDSSTYDRSVVGEIVRALDAKGTAVGRTVAMGGWYRFGYLTSQIIAKTFSASRWCIVSGQYRGRRRDSRHANHEVTSIHRSPASPAIASSTTSRAKPCCNGPSFGRRSCTEGKRQSRDQEAPT